MISYNNKQKLSILLSHYITTSSRKCFELVQFWGDYDKFAVSLSSNKDYIVSVTDDTVYNQLLCAVRSNEIEDIIAALNSRNIICVCYGDSNYSQLLSNISDPPVTLYCKGDISLLDSNCLAIVGTRKISNYGKRVTDNFTMALCQYFTIVSGLAYGVDSIAHKTTLGERGKTIAVLGGGLDHIYPSSHTQLAQQIVDGGGLLVSEYPPSIEPRQYTFPRRNRIVAGLSKGLLVCQASLKSGTFSTIDSALENGRDVFVVPGEIYDYGYMGNNKIIMSMQGAMVTSPLDITKYYGLGTVAIQQSLPLQLPDEEQKIYDMLVVDKVHFNDIVLQCNIQPQQANIILSNMQIKGLIDKLPGNFWCLFGGK